eukprot:1158727-Pelagomonas_calceolata.AAC.2
MHATCSTLPSLKCVQASKIHMLVTYSTPFSKCIQASKMPQPMVMRTPLHCHHIEHADKQGVTYGPVVESISELLHYWLGSPIMVTKRRDNS